MKDEATPEMIGMADRIAKKAAPMGPHSYYVALRNAALAALTTPPAKDDAGRLREAESGDAGDDE